MAKSKKKQRKHRAYRYQQRGGAGAPPGQIEINSDAKPSSIYVTGYSSTKVLERQNCKISDVKTMLGKQAVTWVDIVGLGSRELFEQVGELFGIHRLALSDVAHTPQRPKVERFSDHLFVIAQVPMEGANGKTGQVSFFLGKNYVISWQEFPGRGFPAVRDRLKDASRAIRNAGPDYLFYALLDAVIDASFPRLAAIGDQLDLLEEKIYERSDPNVIGELHQVRRQVRHLRSVTWPLRDALNSLMANNEDLVSQEVKIYLRDCYDHTYQLLDTLEIYRETCSDLRDYHATEVSNNMNEVMKVLTIIATIFIPLSFIAGVYGMNFDSDVSGWNLPETKWRFGYPFALLLMSAMALGQLWFFRKRGWLGSSAK